MATRSSKPTKADTTPLESAAVLLVALAALWYERTILAHAAWEEVTRRLPFIGQHPRLALVGLVVVLVVLMGLVLSGLRLLWRGPVTRRPLKSVSADTLAQRKTEVEVQPVDGLTARGRLTAITALPKQGKTYAYFGLLRARQDGGTWFGRACQPGRTFVLSEEDRGTYAAKVKRFGIRGRTLESLHAPEVDERWFGREAWEDLTHDAARRARRLGCDTLCVDTATTWAPWMFAGAEPMSYGLRTFKRAVGRERLAGTMILHNRKAGSDLGAVVEMLGTIAGAAAYDVVAGFKRERESGECTLVVDGRLGEWQCTARLVDGRYLPLALLAPEQDDAPVAPKLAAHLQPTLERLRGAGDWLTTSELLALEGGAKQPLLDRLRALEAVGLVAHEGDGKPGRPLRWRVTEAPLLVVPVAPVAHRHDPRYRAYLKSPAWKALCAQVKARAQECCEDCGAALLPGEMEVHHLTYARLYAERLEDLAGLCTACHNRAPTPNDAPIGHAVTTDASAGVA